MKLKKIIILSLALSLFGGIVHAEPAKKINNVTSNQYKYLITFEKAKEIALKKVPGAVITDIELDKEGKLFVYDIEMHLNGMEYEIKLNAKTGSGISVKKQKDDPDRQIRANSSKQTTTSAKNTIGAARAKEIALNKAPGGKVVSLKLDRDDGKVVYEGKMIKGNTEYEFDIDAYSGAIIKWDVDYNEYQNSTTSSNQGNQTSTNQISADRAKEIALNKAPGGKVVSLKLDRDDGKVVYEGEIHKGNYEYEFEIDAYSGKILSWDSDHIYD